jgi:cytoskeletal protein RodZ
MKTVGQMLRTAREEKKLSLEDIERGTKIRLKFLEAIESDEFTIMPSQSYVKGFVKNYSEYVGLNSKTVLAFYRRQTVDAPKSHLLPKGMEAPLNRSAFQLTPGQFIFIIVSTLVCVFLLYLFIQYQTLQKPPTLLVDSPVNQEVFSDTRVDVLGKTDPDATVTINGVSVLVRPDGKFFDQIRVEPGINSITITASSRLGKTTTQVVKIGVK